MTKNAFFPVSRRTPKTKVKKHTSIEQPTNIAPIKIRVARRTALDVFFIFQLRRTSCAVVIAGALKVRHTKVTILRQHDIEY